MSSDDLDKNIDSICNGNVEMPSIFLQKGMVANIINFKISQTNSGFVGTFDLTIQPAMLVYWLKIALHHLDLCKKHHELVLETREEGGEKLGDALELEFLSSIQAIVATATGFDAFYAEIKKLINIPEDQRDKWKSKRTARWKQVCEVLRIAFKLNNENFKKIRRYCRELYEFRGSAVHPSAESLCQFLYEEINLLIEWRFARYNYKNAFNLVGVAFIFIDALLSSIKKDDTAIAIRAKQIFEEFHPLFELWHNSFDTRTHS